MRHPDLILYNATVHTLDANQPRGELVAVQDGRVSFVGKARAFEELRGPETRGIDCQGGCLIPGFHDAHLHLLALAARLVGVDCSPESASSVAALQETLRQRARETSPGKWLRGYGYDDWAMGRHPTRQELDGATSDHPVRLVHRSGHAAILNSLALQQVGITGQAPDPPEGVIERDEHGEPTGLLFEMDAYLEGSIPQLPPQELEEGVRQARYCLLSRGITTVHDATPTNDLTRWQLLKRLLEDRGPRIVFLPGIAALGEFHAQGMEYGSGDGRMWLGPAKIMLTQTTGALVPPAEELLALVAMSHENGFPVAIHAVEAEAVSAAAKAICRAWSKDGVPLIDRIEHASELPPEVLEEVIGCGAMVVTNPGFLYSSGARYRSQVPQEMQPWLYRIGTLQWRGVRLAFGSDAPVETPDPIAELYAAVTRRSADGGLLAVRERISPAEALEAHTLGGAWVAGSQGWLGTLSIGMAADLLLLDQDPLSLDPEELREVHPQMTLVNGQVVWEA